MDSGSYFLTPICQDIHGYEEQVWARGRSLAQPHIHVDSVAFASCKSYILISNFSQMPCCMFCIGITYISGTMHSIVHLQIPSLSPHCLLRDEDRIMGASPWHESKL